MEKDIKISDSTKAQTQGMEITDKQIEILSRRLLPEIKKFFADEKIQLEFEEWKEKRKDIKTK